MREGLKTGQDPVNYFMVTKKTVINHYNEASISPSAYNRISDDSTKPPAKN
jgi:hypothetical protein